MDKYRHIHRHTHTETCESFACSSQFQSKINFKIRKTQSVDVFGLPLVGQCCCCCWCWRWWCGCSSTGPSRQTVKVCAVCAKKVAQPNEWGRQRSERSRTNRMKLNVILKYVPKGKRARAHPPKQTHTHIHRERPIHMWVVCGAGAKAISVLKLLHKLAVLAALSGLSTACLLADTVPLPSPPPSPLSRSYIYFLAYTSHGQKAANTLPLTVAGLWVQQVRQMWIGGATAAANGWKGVPVTGKLHYTIYAADWGPEIVGQTPRRLVQN